MTVTYTDLDSIHDPTAGAYVPSAWGKAVRRNQQRLASPPHVMVETGINIPVEYDEDTTVTFVAAVRDLAGMWTGRKPDTLTVVHPGIYLVWCAVNWGQGAAAYEKRLALLVNGETVAGQDVTLSVFGAPGNVDIHQSIAHHLVLEATDELTFTLYQNYDPGPPSITINCQSVYAGAVLLAEAP